MKKVLFSIMLTLFCFGILLAFSEQKDIKDLPVPKPVETITIPNEVYVEKATISLFKDFSYVTSTTSKEAEIKLQEINAYVDYLYTLVPSEDISPYHMLISHLVLDEIQLTLPFKLHYQNDYKNLKEKEFWDKCYNEYPIATEVWLYLKNTLGYSDYVCAGIMGNMMAETGGGTLNLVWNLYDEFHHYYYGICQWSPEYYPEVIGTDLQTQLEFLRKTIKFELDEYGFVYAARFNYQNFLELDDEYEAAIAFCVSYERCLPEYVAVRGAYAREAYRYFKEAK